LGPLGWIGLACQVAGVVLGLLLFPKR
jgi:hypothetical protein